MEPTAVNGLLALRQKHGESHQSARPHVRRLEVWYAPVIKSQFLQMSWCQKAPGHQQPPCWLVCNNSAAEIMRTAIKLFFFNQEADSPLVFFALLTSSYSYTHCSISLNTLRPRQNGRHFPDDIFKVIFFYGNCFILIKISLKFVPCALFDNIPALVQIMAWRRSGDKPLSEPMIAYVVKAYHYMIPLHIDAKYILIFPIDLFNSLCPSGDIYIYIYIGQHWFR